MPVRLQDFVKLYVIFVRYNSTVTCLFYALIYSSFTNLNGDMPDLRKYEKIIIYRLFCMNSQSVQRKYLNIIN